MKLHSAVPRADPVQQVMHDAVVESVAHRPPGPGRTHPTLIPQHPKSLGDRVFRSPEGGGQITDADTRSPVQAEQDLQSVRIREQVETPRPAGRVDVGKRRRRAIDLTLLSVPRHSLNLAQDARGARRTFAECRRFAAWWARDTHALRTVQTAQSRKPCSRAADPATWASIAASAPSTSPARMAMTIASCWSSECAILRGSNGI